MSYDFSIDEEKFSYESKVSECQKISDGIYCDDERYYFIIGDKFAFTYKDYFEDFYPATRGNAKEEYDE